MTHPIPVGAIFELHAADDPTKVIARVVHLGDGMCDPQRLTNKGNFDNFGAAPVKMSQAQLEEWLKRLTGKDTAFEAMFFLPTGAE